ncbi:MAG: hypothetical protein V4492_01745 [Chlamydiota bacterium]
MSGRLPPVDHTRTNTTNIDGHAPAQHRAGSPEQRTIGCTLNPFTLLGRLGRGIRDGLATFGNRVVSVFSRTNTPPATAPLPARQTQYAPVGEITNVNLEQTVETLTSAIEKDQRDNPHVNCVTLKQDVYDRVAPEKLGIIDRESVHFLDTSFTVSTSIERNVLQVKKQANPSPKKQSFAFAKYRGFIASNLTEKAQELVCFCFTQGLPNLINQTLVAQHMKTDEDANYLPKFVPDAVNIDFTFDGASVELDGVVSYSSGQFAFEEGVEANRGAFAQSGNVRIKVRVDFTLDENGQWKIGGMRFVNKPIPSYIASTANNSPVTTKGTVEKVGTGRERMEREDAARLSNFDRFLGRRTKPAPERPVTPEATAIVALPHPQPETFVVGKKDDSFSFENSAQKTSKVAVPRSKSRGGYPVGFMSNRQVLKVIGSPPQASSPTSWTW